MQGQVWHVIEELGLEQVANNKIGGQISGRGMSGGERRRCVGLGRRCLSPAPCCAMLWCPVWHCLYHAGSLAQICKLHTLGA